ncbi:hypothetical protein JRQ81_012308, partial [Phrynocephalus forsythii]
MLWLPSGAKAQTEDPSPSDKGLPADGGGETVLAEAAQRPLFRGSAQEGEGAATARGGSERAGKNPSGSPSLCSEIDAAPMKSDQDPLEAFEEMAVRFAAFHGGGLGASSASSQGRPEGPTGGSHRRREGWRRCGKLGLPVPRPNFVPWQEEGEDPPMEEETEEGECMA